MQTDVIKQLAKNGGHRISGNEEIMKMKKAVLNVNCIF